MHETLNIDDAEAALILRRCAMISNGRGQPLDAQISAEPWGRCFSQQPDRAPTALRVRGSTWDFTGRVEALCADDQGWIAFQSTPDQ